MNVSTSRSNHLPMMESTFLNTNAPRNDKFKTNYSTGNYPNSRPSPFCDYCKCPVYTKDKCFKLHDYLQNNNFNPRFNKGKRITINVHDSPVDSILVKDDGVTSQGCNDNNNNNNNNSSLNLSKEKYGQPFNLLQQFHIRGGGEKTTNPGFTNGTANFASIFACSASALSIKFSLLSCRCFTPSADLRILDSGASNHMYSNKSLQSHTKTMSYPLVITLPNGC